MNFIYGSGFIEEALILRIMKNNQGRKKRSFLPSLVRILVVFFSFKLEYKGSITISVPSTRLVAQVLLSYQSMYLRVGWYYLLQYDELSI